MSIRRKFQLLAAVVLLGLASLLFVIESVVIQEITTKCIEKEIQTIFSHRNAVREYTLEVMQPKILELIGKDGFLTELQCGNYIVDQIDHRLKNDFGNNMVYKIASIKPRNPRNMAHKFESDIINGMEEQYREGQAPTWEGQTRLDGKEYYVFARGQITKDSCLRCHGAPEDAPAALKKRYPPEDDTGYGHERDRVVAADFIYLPQDMVEGQLHGIRLYAMGITLIALILAMVGLRFALKRIFLPIIQVTGVAQLIARGNLDQASSDMDTMMRQQRLDSRAEAGHTRNEVVGMAAAFAQMIKNLNSLIGNFKSAEAHLSSTASQITASAVQLEATASQQAAAANQVKATSKAISNRSHQLVQTMDSMAEGVEKTAGLANDGRDNLEEMKGAMQELMDASGAISSKLSTINERTQNITGIVSTITKVAEKTNLLSLNASIEAEKAGEHGLGFFIVAREIRRLADQTAVSATSIGQMVKEMRSSVSSGVMEMDKFIQKVNQSVNNVSRIGDGLADVITQVEALAPHFETLKDVTREQTTGADEINQAMIQLTEGIESAKESLTEFKEVTRSLVEASRNMEEEVSHFILEE